jgi:hypothetical protein
MPENASTTEPLPGPATAIIQEKIHLHAVSVYEKPGVAAQSLGYLIKPVSHGPGHPHLISIHILALLLDYRIEILKQWAAAGDCFIKLVWIFPGWNHPEFTTRHLLVTDTAPGHVSFSGGLGWAEDMWKAAQRLQPPTCPYFSGRQILTPRWNIAALPPKGGGTKLPRLRPVVPFMDLAQWKARYQTVTYPSRGMAEDSVSEPSLEDPPALTDAASDDSSAVFSSEPAEMAAEMAAAEDSNFGEDSCQDHKTGDSGGSQSQLDMLRRQKREAEALYARNGDPSGLLALLAAASQSTENWDASGMPRF